MAFDRNRYLSCRLRLRGNCEPGFLPRNGLYDHLERNSRARSAPGRLLLRPVSSLASGSVRPHSPRTAPISLLRPRRPLRCAALRLRVGIFFQYCGKPKIVLALLVSALWDCDSQSTFVYSRGYQSPSRAIPKPLQRQIEAEGLTVGRIRLTSTCIDQSLGTFAIGHRDIADHGY